MLFLFARHRLRILKHRIMVLGGIISYGIYLLHPWLSYPLRGIFQYFNIESPIIWPLYLVFLLTLSFVCARIVYVIYEKPIRTLFNHKQIA